MKVILLFRNMNIKQYTLKRPNSPCKKNIRGCYLIFFVLFLLDFSPFYQCNVTEGVLLEIITWIITYNGNGLFKKMYQ